MPIAGVSPRLLEIGRIRMGEKGTKGEPVKLDHWRLTSSHVDSLNAAEKLWGGVVGEWQGGYELLTETDVLEVMVPPNAFTSYLEAWTKGGIQRRCDGLTELVTGEDCICSAEGSQVCEPASNLRVLLPTLPGIGSWRLATKGWTAAAELQGTIELLQRTAHTGEWPAAELFLDHRSKVVAGQTRRFVVPVLRLPYSLNDLAASETRSLGSGAIVRVDTHTGEINPEPPSRETPPGAQTVESPSVSSPGGMKSAPPDQSSNAFPTRGPGADGGDGVDSASSVPPTSSSDEGRGLLAASTAPSSGPSSSAGTTAARGTGERTSDAPSTADPADDLSPEGEPAPHQSSQSGRDRPGAEPSGAPRSGEDVKDPADKIGKAGPPSSSPEPRSSSRASKQSDRRGGGARRRVEPERCTHTNAIDADGCCVDCGTYLVEVSS